MQTRRLLAVLLPLVFTTACSAAMRVVSSEKKAYAVKSSGFGTNMYRCDATSGKPICRKVEEVD